MLKDSPADRRENVAGGPAVTANWKSLRNASSSANLAGSAALAFARSGKALGLVQIFAGTPNGRIVGNGRDWGQTGLSGNAAQDADIYLIH